MRSIGLPEVLVLYPFLALPIMLIPGIFYMLTLYRALGRCSAGARTLSPGLVWLMLIPLFGLVWHFVVVLNISKSLHNEFTARGTPGVEPEPGRGIGLATCILGACGIIPFVGILSGLAGVVCWIMYWVKISGYSRMLWMPQVAR